MDCDELIQPPPLQTFGCYSLADGQKTGIRYGVKFVENVTNKGKRAVGKKIDRCLEIIYFYTVSTIPDGVSLNDLKV